MLRFPTAIHDVLAGEQFPISVQLHHLIFLWSIGTFFSIPNLYPHCVNAQNAQRWINLIGQLYLFQLIFSKYNHSANLDRLQLCEMPGFISCQQLKIDTIEAFHQFLQNPLCRIWMSSRFCKQCLSIVPTQLDFTAPLLCRWRKYKRDTRGGVRCWECDRDFRRCLKPSIDSTPRITPPSRILRCIGQQLPSPIQCPGSGLKRCIRDVLRTGNNTRQTGKDLSCITGSLRRLPRSLWDIQISYC